MKFKELRRLIEQYDLLETLTEGKGIMIPGYNGQQASDGSVGLHQIEIPEMIERVNAFIAHFLSDVPSSGMLDPRDKLVRLRVELNKIGLDFKYDGKTYPKTENMEFHLTQFGGRKGVDEKGNQLNDCGISHRLGHSLKLVVTLKHPPETGFHALEAKVVPGDAPVDVPHEGGSEAAATFGTTGINIEDKKKVNEEKDACYFKVKAAHKVFPSAYASGNLVQCREVGAENWNKKSKD